MKYRFLYIFLLFFTFNSCWVINSINESSEKSYQFDLDHNMVNQTELRNLDSPKHSTLDDENIFYLKKDCDKIKYRGELIVSPKRYSGRVYENHLNNVTKYKGQYKLGEKEGKWLYYYPSGNLHKIVRYKYGIEDSLYQEFFLNGNIKVLGFYHNGNRDGKWIHYRGESNSGLNIINSNELELFIKELNKKEKNFNPYNLYNYEKGVLVSNGRYIEYDSMGKRIETKKNCIKCGFVWKEKNEFRNKCVLPEKLISNNFSNAKTKDSINKSYYKNGQLKEVYIYDKLMKYFTKDGIQIINNGNGVFKSYWNNGNSRLEINYNNGFKNGVEKNWYENGELKFEGEWSDGKGEGIHKNWHQDGELRMDIVYWKNGDHMQRIYYKDLYIIDEFGVSDIKKLKGKIPFYNGKAILEKKFYSTKTGDCLYYNQ